MATTAVYHSSLSRRRQPYPWAVPVSVGLHLALFVGALVLSLIKPAPKIDLQKPIVAKLVKLGKPRDPNLLPVKPTAPPPPDVAAKVAPTVTPDKSAPTPDAKAAPAPSEKPTAPKPNDSKAKLDEIMKRFKPLAAAGKAQDEVGQLDGDPEGDSETAEEGERYLALVQKRIKQQYQVPATIPDQERIHLRAVVRLWVTKGGQISRHEIVEASTNPTFDSALEAAIQRANPLPPPPPHLAPLLSGDGLDVRFKL